MLLWYDAFPNNNTGAVKIDYPSFRMICPSLIGQLFRLAASCTGTLIIAFSSPSPGCASRL
jgi:hypothetical protein